MLKIREQALDYFVNVAEFAFRNGHTTELVKQLNYLDTYGDEDRNGRMIVALAKDFAPLSFAVVWYRRKPHPAELKDAIPQTPWDKPGEYVYVPFMNGGLIWHEPEGSWSVHT